VLRRVLRPCIGQRPWGWAADVEAAKPESMQPGCTRTPPVALAQLWIVCCGCGRTRGRAKAAPQRKAAPRALRLLPPPLGGPTPTARATATSFSVPRRLLVRAVLLRCYNPNGAGSKVAARPRWRRRECPPAVLFLSLCGVPGVRSYSTMRACLLDFIVCASRVHQHLGVVHSRAPSAHGVIERVLLQTEQHAGVVFIVFTAVLQAVRSRHKYSWLRGC
jgi:hypothetical protein